MQEFKNRIDYLLLTKKEDQNGRSKKDFEYKDFYFSIIDELSIRLNTKISKNYYVFKKNSLFKKFKESYEIIEQYQEDNEIHNKVEIKKFQFLAIRLVMDFLSKIGVPLSLTSVVNNMHKVPGLVDNAFPGYAQYNLIHTIFK